MKNGLSFFYINKVNIKDMTKFLLERVGNNLIFDFEREVENAKSYADWRQDPMEIIYSDDDGNVPDLSNPKDYVPVGSIEFVSEYMKKYFPDHTRGLIPINVPECLFKYAGREIMNVPSSGLENGLPNTFGDKIYRKSNLIIKDENNGLIDNTPDIDLKNCQVSSYVDNIISEWRVFVFKNEVQQVCFYGGGDPLVFPSSGRILRMIDDYKDEAPAAYTLDVFTAPTMTWNNVERTETYVMECHRFFSCRLYGFADYSKLPYMFSQTFYEMINM